MRYLSTKTSFACQGSSCPTTNPGCNPTTRLAGTGYFPEWSIIVGWILATVPVALMLATLAEESSVFLHLTNQPYKSLDSDAFLKCRFTRVYLSTHSPTKKNKCVFADCKGPSQSILL